MTRREIAFSEGIMKKITALFTIILLCTLCLALSACADGNTTGASRGLSFTSSGDGGCFVSGIGSCKDSEIVIPATSPAGEQVTSIGNCAFSDCLRLTSVTLPSTVTKIESHAFSGCSNLTTISIPDSVSSIEANAFQGCDSLAFNVQGNAKYLGNAEQPYFALITAKDKNIAFCTISADTKVIADEAFRFCDKLTQISIPDGVIRLGAGTFAKCSKLTEVALPAGLREIGDATFWHCDSLRAITIPDGVSSIGVEAFRACGALGSIMIPDSVTAFGAGVFADCAALRDVYYTGSEEQWGEIWESPEPPADFVHYNYQP